MTDEASIPTIYNFDAETGEFLFASVADPDPLVEDRFLIPANATLIPPPVEQEGNVRRFVGGAWGYSPIEDTETPPTEGPVVTTAMVDAVRDMRINSGFGFEGNVYQARAEDRENIAGAVKAATDAITLFGAEEGDYAWQRLLDPAAPAEFRWIAADNNTHLMDAQTVMRFGYAALGHKQSHIFAARELKDMDPIPADYATNPAYWP
ncbi:DUF4376 domain-containing protein [Agrobacterium tumefaciens]|uniref:DUF4376 domain-containing protein n=1 Tax=Agrobacterium tumefaciens TaxID=358 RepID=UPI001178966C